MNKKIFLFNFKSHVPSTEIDMDDSGDLQFDHAEQVNVTEGGQIAWFARSKRPPTSCYTSGHRIKAGYTRSGKWKPSRWIPGKTDRRAGR